MHNVRPSFLSRADWAQARACHRHTGLLFVFVRTRIVEPCVVCPPTSYRREEWHSNLSSCRTWIPRVDTAIAAAEPAEEREEAALGQEDGWGGIEGGPWMD